MSCFIFTCFARMHDGVIRRIEVHSSNQHDAMCKVFDALPLAVSVSCRVDREQDLTPCRREADHG